MEREQTDNTNNTNNTNNPNTNTENKKKKTVLIVIAALIIIILFIIFLFGNSNKPNNNTDNTQNTEQQSQGNQNTENQETEQQPIEKEVALLKEEYLWGMLVNQYEYNEYGEITKKIGYDFGGELETITTYEYDDLGNIIKEVEDRRDHITEFQYVYDEHNRLVAKIEPKAEDLPDTVPTVKEEYIYDEKGNKVECNKIYIYPGENGEIIEDLWDGTNYTYDENNNLILKEEYDTGKCEVEEFVKYEYDKKGNIIKESHYDYMYSVNGEPVLIFLYIHEYDENNNEIYFEDHSYSVNGTYCGKNVDIYKYDSNNNVIEFNEYAYGQNDNVFHHRQTVYTYNEHNHVIKEVLVDKLTESQIGLVEYEYTYNSDGSYIVYGDMSGREYTNNTSEKHYDKFGNLTYTKTVYSEDNGMFGSAGDTNSGEFKYETVTIKVRPNKQKT